MSLLLAAMVALRLVPRPLLASAADFAPLRHQPEARDLPGDPPRPRALPAEHRSDVRDALHGRLALGDRDLGQQVRRAPQELAFLVCHRGAIDRYDVVLWTRALLAHRRRPPPSMRSPSSTATARRISSPISFV